MVHIYIYILYIRKQTNDGIWRLPICAPFLFRIPGVVEAIQFADDVPNSVRQMLIAMLPEAEESFETY